MEHRQGSRYPTLALVEIQSQNHYGTGLVYNISYDGVFVVSDIKTERNDIIDIHLSLTTNEKNTVCIPGMVVHRRNHGFGIIFRDLDKKALKVVDRLLNQPRATHNNRPN